MDRLEDFLENVAVEEDGEGSLRLSGTIRGDCPVFDGHFPGNPVFPGAFHVWIAFLAAARGLGREGAPLAGIEKARFRKLLGPGDRVTIMAAWGAADAPGGGLAARCRIEKEGAEASRFTVLFGAGGGPRDRA